MSVAARFVLVLLVCVLRGSFSEHIDTGAPAGWLSNCPGMDKPGRLTLRGLRRFRVKVQHNGVVRQFAWHSKTDDLNPLNGLGAADRVFRSGIMNSKAKTVVYFTGYLDNYHFPAARAAANHYDKLGYNVLSFDTFDLYTRPYTDASRLIEPLGEAMADFLAHLTSRKLIKPSSLELAGISMGAQQAGAVGRTYYKKVGAKISRITGLEPAGPCFRNLPEGRRLSPNDAERVDVVHTNNDGLGTALPVGHVDFYMNGGEFTPLQISTMLLPCINVCSHVHSFLYWWAALQNPDGFIGVKCPSLAKARIGDCFDGPLETNLMGPKTNFSKPGLYYLETSASFPFFVGKNGLRKKPLGVNDFLNTVFVEDLVI